MELISFETFAGGNLKQITAEIEKSLQERLVLNNPILSLLFSRPIAHLSQNVTEQRVLI